jgi:hypothetical protein
MPMKTTFFTGRREPHQQALGLVGASMAADHSREAGELVLDDRQLGAQTSREEILEARLAAGLRQRLGPVAQHA